VTRFVKSFSLAVSIFTGGLNFQKGDVVLPFSEDIVEAKSNIAHIFEEVKQIMKAYGIDGELELLSGGGGFVIRLSDTVLFDLGKSERKPEAVPFLNKMGALLSKTSHLIRIEGHTDNLPINTEKFPSNWELSTTRAISVLRYFIEQGGILPGRLSAEGYGEYQPLFANDSHENRSKNRRVEIMIYKK